MSHIDAERPQAAPRDAYRVFRAITTRWADNDMYGHVNNVVYLRYAQEAAVAHWRARATDEYVRTFVWVVRRHEVDYLKPAFPDDKLEALLRGLLYCSCCGSAMSPSYSSSKNRRYR